jgi:hypothetical protein
LALFEQGDTGNELIELALHHKQEMANHAVQCAAHERIKNLHHQVITHLTHLQKAFDAPE